MTLFKNAIVRLVMCTRHLQTNMWFTFLCTQFHHWEHLKNGVLIWKGPLLITPRTNKLLVVAIDYFDGIVTRFGIPLEMISDNGPQFINEVIEELMKKLVIKHKITTTYKPSTNGLVECTNKVLCNILNKEAKVHKNLHN